MQVTHSTNSTATDRLVDILQRHIDSHADEIIDLVNLVAASTARPGEPEAVAHAVSVGLLVPVAGSIGLYEVTVSDWRDVRPTLAG